MRTADQQVVKAAAKVRILGALSWPASVEERFLTAYRSGNRLLPEPPALDVDLSADEALADAIARCDPQDPLDAFVIRTGEAYRQALAMLQAAGTPGFVDHSRALFGGPDDPVVPGETVTLCDEADHLLTAARAIDAPEPQKTLGPSEARDWLQARVDETFGGELPVELEPALVSLATAGWKRVRLRGGVNYGIEQLEQLLQHEALVHSLTKRNGRDQPTLGCLGLSSPRTLAVQEGLATMAEMITDALDLVRLRRIALRVRMTDAALSGADFIEVFEALLDAGQPERDAFRSAMRLFRGGDVRGGIVFTKDVVYLKGLRQVHSFLLAALRAHRAELPEVLFTGRLTCGDALELAPLVGTRLSPPTVLPDWVERRGQLSAYLSWAAFGQRVHEVPLTAFAN